MNSLPAFFAALPGFLVGLLCVPLITHWIALLLTALGKPDPRRGAAPSGRVWPTIFTVVHPVPWVLLLGLPFGIHRLIVNTPTPPWLWFFGAIATTLIAMTAVGFLFARKVRKQVALNVVAKGANSGRVV
jgi:hypothetical protein